jgi:hypothetical protein
MLLIVKIINGSEHSIQVRNRFSSIRKLLFFLPRPESKMANLFVFKQPQVAPYLTIHDLKQSLATQLNIPINQQRLMFKGKPLTGILAKLASRKEYHIKYKLSIYL